MTKMKRTKGRKSGKSRKNRTRNKIRRTRKIGGMNALKRTFGFKKSQVSNSNDSEVIVNIIVKFTSNPNNPVIYKKKIKMSDIQKEESDNNKTLDIVLSDNDIDENKGQATGQATGAITERRVNI